MTGSLENPQAMDPRMELERIIGWTDTLWGLELT